MHKTRKTFLWSNDGTSFCKLKATLSSKHYVPELSFLQARCPSCWPKTMSKHWM